MARYRPTDYNLIAGYIYGVHIGGRGCIYYIFMTFGVSGYRSIFVRSLTKQVGLACGTTGKLGSKYMYIIIIMLVEFSASI